MRRTRRGFDPGALTEEELRRRIREVALKDRAHHREVASQYDRSVTNNYSIYHEWDLEPWVRHAAQLFPGGRALDVGSGTGVVALALSRQGLDVCGVDHSLEMINVACAKAPSSDAIPRFVVGDVLRMPFSDSTFDIVTIQGVLHHIPLAQERMLAEATRVLRAGGLLYISEPCDDSSALGRLLRARWWYRGTDPDGELTDEEAVVWSRLEACLISLGIGFRVHFLTHVPSAHFHYWLPKWARINITRLLSWPFATGDLVFVHGRKER